MTTTEERIDQLLASEDLWASIDELSADAAPDLIDRVRGRLLAGAGDHASALVLLLARMGEQGATALCEVLGESDDLDRLVLKNLPLSRSSLSRNDLLPFLRRDSDDLARIAISAAGLSGDLSLAPEVFRHWDSELRLDVALCLGRLRAKDYTPHLVELVELPSERLSDRKWEFAAVALEAMTDPASRAHVLELLKTAPTKRVWSLVQILRRISDFDLSGDWIAEDGKGDLEELRQSWLGPAPSPGLDSVEIRSANVGQLLLHGTGEIRLSYPPATSVGSWPRWDRALYWGDDVLFNANSDCPTCETYLRRTGTTSPRLEADRVGQALADVAELSTGVLESLAPMLGPLPSGRYHVALTLVPVERIDESMRDSSWYAKRGELRLPDDPEWDDPDERPAPMVCWPGTAHYQRPELLRASPPTSMTILPTQPLQDVDESTVASRRDAIRNGQRPAVLALAWYEHRDIEGGYPEAMLQCVVLDGHHTLEAYAREGRPAQLLLLLPWAFSWVPALKGAIDLLA